MKGILLVDKPSGMTSHDVVDAIRKVAGTRKVGHTGTLDPGATGLLILCIGQATRLSEFLTGMDKVYEGDMRLGVSTDSYDMDGKVTEERPVPELSMDAIQAVCDEFTGEFLQVPPMVSAVKIGGERLYKRARKGEVVERPPRVVKVDRFDVLSYAPPLVHFQVACSRGTYVRSLCHDVGEKLSCGGTLDSLRRTAVGKHTVDDALPLDAFDSRDVVRERLLGLGEALEMPEVTALPSGERLVSGGNPLRLSDLDSECPVSGGMVQVKSSTGELLALAEVGGMGGEPLIKPKRVFSG